MCGQTVTITTPNPPRTIRRAVGESGPTVWTRLFGIDLRSLAAMRIGLAVLLLVDLIDRGGDLTAHYTDFGTMPRSLVADRVADSPWSLSLHMISGTAPIEAVLFIAAGVCALALLVGWYTRLFNILSWFLLMSLHNRNPMILQGGDVLLRMMLFFGMFLPLGAQWSIDSVWRAGPGARGICFSAATVALLLQIAFMYWFSVFLKTDPSWWRDFTAVYYALSLTHFVRPAGLLLLPYGGFLKALTISTLLVEGLGPVAAFASGLLRWPARTAVVLSFILFHAGMGLCLELGLFSLICSVAWLPFLPGGFWDWLQAKWPYRSRSSQVRNIFGPLLDLPGKTSPLLTYNLNPTRLNHVCAAFFIAYVFLWNLRSINHDRFVRFLPHRFDFVAWLSGTCQVGDMFSPCPLREVGWFVMPAQLADGEEVDLFRQGAPVSWEKPPLISAMYKNDRWRKYMVVLAAASSTDRRLPYAQWLARTWNETHPPDRQILTFQIFLMLQTTVPDYKTAPAKPLMLWTHDCRPEPTPEQDTSDTDLDQD